MVIIGLLDIGAAFHQIVLAVFNLLFAVLCALTPSARSIQYADTWMRKAATSGSLTTTYAWDGVSP
jgi:hypothetical protein